MRRVFRTSLTIAVVYLLLGGLWIYFSDTALKALVDDVDTMRWMQTWKGWSYVLVTGVIVFWTSMWVLSRQNELIGRLEDLAFRHPLTGLPSRSAAASLVAEAVADAEKHATRIAVVQFDVDHFSNINDSFGHEIGDELLRKMAAILQGCMGENGRLAHLGADEFLIVFEGVVDRSDLAHRLDALWRELSRPVSLRQDSEVYVSASMGVSLYPDDSRLVNELLRFSDAALARAKRSSPGTTEMFNADMLECARRRLEIDARLRAAIEFDELELHFQPIYQQREGFEIIGMEALLRWHPPGEDPISPGEFISVAEQSGLILELGDWIIERVCSQIAEWRHKGLSLPPVSMNLSVRQFQAPGLVGKICGGLDRHGLPRSAMVLELTESLLMEQGDDGREILGLLRAEGFRIALDDFGTGYSSLSYLSELPIDELKIDRSFVANLDRARSDRDLVAAMISLADIFGLRVIAEGVETTMQREMLGKLGCHCFQGYLFSRPVAADEVVKLLQAESGKHED